MIAIFREHQLEKLAEIDSHIGCAMSGRSADARTLIDHARSESQYHRFTFNEPMKVDSLTQAVCDLALRFGESGEENTMSRPFGVALLVAACQAQGEAAVVAAALNLLCSYATAAPAVPWLSKCGVSSGKFPVLWKERTSRNMAPALTC